MDVRVAPKNDRLSHYLIDLFVVAFGVVILETIGKRILSRDLFLFLGYVPIGFMGNGLLFYLGIMLYYTVSESIWGRTLGKKATGCWVVRKDGGTPRVRQILWRSFLRLIYLDWISYLFGKEVGMHDSVSNTLVVKELPEPPAEEGRTLKAERGMTFKEYVRSIG